MDTARLDLSADPGFMLDPYPTLRSLREAEPSVHRVLYHGAPAWFVTRISDGEAAYADARLSADNANTTDEIRAVSWIAAPDLVGLGRSMVYADPPTHTRMRRIVAGAFTSRRVQGLRPMVQGIADDLLDGLVPYGGFDVLNGYSSPLAAQTIMLLFGAPLDDRETFAGYSNLFLSTDPADQAKLPDALAWMADYIARLVAAKAARPTDDLLSELIAAHDGAGGRLNETELHSMALLLLMAGFETTASFIPNGLHALIENPEQMAALRADPSLIPSAVEEMLRYYSTSASLPRYAKEDLRLGGVDIRRGEAVIVSWAAANRDPRRFDNPDAFDIRRTENRHISFAYGIHHCLGAPLARLESQIAFATLLARCDDIRLAVPSTELVYRITPNVRAVVEFPITFTPKGT